MLALSLVAVWMLTICPAWAKGSDVSALPCAVASFVQRLPEGKIDWGSGVIQAQGVSASGTLAANEAQAEAFKAAQRGLTVLLRGMYISSGKPIAGLLESNTAAGAELANIVRAARIVNRGCYSDGSVEVWAALSIRGGFMQLVLPREVTSISTVRQVNGAKARPGNQYTGLIVDARGLDVRPALCPRLLGEDDGEVFGPALLRREAAIQRGVAAYTTAMPGAGEIRTGARPIVVKALRTCGPGRCDMVLGRADAVKVRSAPESLEFLRCCKVLIVVD